MSILVSFDKSHYLNEKKAIEDIASNQLQNVVNEYEKLKLKPLHQSDFINLFKDPVTLIFKKITGGIVILNNVELDQAKANEIIKKPLGYEVFIGLVNFTLDKLKATHRQPGNAPITIENLSKFFELDENLIVKVKPSLILELEGWFKKYAITEKAKRAMEFTKDFIALYKKHEMEKNSIGRGDSVGVMLNELVITKNNGVLSINEEGVLRCNL